MKKTLLSLPVILLAISATAQPVIQATEFNYLAAPTFQYKYQAGQVAIAPGAAGANVNWDFRSLTATTNLNYNTQACPGDADCVTFPGANQVIGVGGAAKVYYQKTGTDLSQIGEKATANIIFTNPMKVMQFPLTFNQTYSDDYVSTGNGNKSGRVYSSIDGYGTLQTPTGTYNNVLRQKLVDSATVVSGDQNVQMVFTQYYWFAANIHHHVMAIIVTEFVGVPAPATYVVTFTTQQGTVGINDKDLLANGIVIYPNPAQDVLHIATNELSVNYVELYNIVGQRVWSQQVESRINKLSIPLENLQLNAGNYFIKLNTEKGSVSKQVIIK